MSLVLLLTVAAEFVLPSVVTAPSADVAPIARPWTAAMPNRRAPRTDDVEEPRDDRGTQTDEPDDDEDDDDQDDDEDA